MELKPGSRLRSASDTTEVVVIRTPGDPVDLRCGGHPMRAIEADESDPAPVEAGFDGGALLGKRYCDEEVGLEVLCTKAGAASLSVGAALLAVKGAKPLPASD
jgi:hypothetical protein